jgi:transmembrane sensor
MSSKNQIIDDIAVEWAAKEALRELTCEEKSNLDAWLAADIRHLGAFTKAKAVIARVHRTLRASADELNMSESPPAPNYARRRILIAGGAGASVAAACLLGVMHLQSGKKENSVVPANFSTAIGQTREILIPDGSVITLNTNSRVSVELTPEARNIYLLKGEALFDVAKNKNRPFVVFAGYTQIKAIGTSFSVSVLPKKPIRVIVREGLVEVKKRDAAPVWLSADARAVVRRDAPIKAESISKVQVARQLSWQYGRIAIDHGTLLEAANEFARYSDIPIVVDPAVANRTITGMFASNDPAAFANAAATVLKLHVQVSEEEVRIYQ